MILKVLNLIGLIILIAHLNGCLQFIVPMYMLQSNDSWVSLNNFQVCVLYSRTITLKLYLIEF